MNRTQLIAVTLWACIGFSALAQNLIVNGSFELPDDGQTHSYLTPDSWQSTNGMTGQPVIYFDVNYSQDGKQYIAIGTEGTGIHNNLSQSFTVTNAGSFLLTWFDQIPAAYGPQQSIYSVTLFDSSNSIITNNILNAYHPSPGWKSESTQFVLAGGTYTLRFQGLVAPGGVGSLLDNVSVIQTEDNSDLATSIFSAVSICWPGRTNQMYQVQYRTNLTSTNWFDLGSAVAGAGTNCITDVIMSGQQRFYHVVRMSSN